MGTILLAVLPVFLLIFGGALARRRGFPGDAFWEPAERLTYFVLFPALLVTTLAEAEFTGLEPFAMAGAILAAIAVMTALLLALKAYLGVSGPAFTSLYQGAVRMNTYIGLAVAFQVHGTQGLAAAAVAVAAIVPTVNVLSVAILARYGAHSEPSWSGVARQLARNPLILGCAVGLVLNVTGIGLPPVLREVLLILGRAALPLALLAVGAGLDLTKVRGFGREVALTTALKLLAMPALTAGAALLLGLPPVAAFVAVLFNGLPTASASYILARQLGGDAPLMASLITVQVLLAMVTLPLVLTVLI